MPLPRVYLFVERGNEECEEAERLLASHNIPYEKIYVDENHARGAMLWEYGTKEVPLIATPDAVVVGLENIREFLARNAKSLSK
ncbi:MAG: hypothetical protein DRJ56_07755 [Thermoprotei archaeon]|nr:MAG: hypothetical protein DRJ56_07755 [Thermoprotei archaeon]